MSFEIQWLCSLVCRLYEARKGVEEEEEEYEEKRNH
jgi:hypothetical protein